MSRCSAVVSFCILACVASCDAADTSSVDKVSSALEVQVADLELSNFSIWSTEATVLRDRANVSGFVGSAKRVELSADAVITGDLYAGNQGCFLGNRSKVDGNMTTSGALTIQDGAVITGSSSEYAKMPDIVISTKTITPGTANWTVEAGQTLNLEPGAYATVSVKPEGTLVLSSGTYQLSQFTVDASSVRVDIQAGSGPVVINVAGQLQFGDRTKIHLVGASDPSVVQFYSNQIGTVRLGVDSLINGTIVVPNGEIDVPQRAAVFGDLYAKRVTVEADATVNGPSSTPALPVLTPTSQQPSFEPGAAAPVLRSRSVTVDVSAIESSRNQQLQIEFFSDVSLKAVGKRIERYGANGYVWVGRIDGQPQSQVVLAVNSGVLAGDVHTETGDYYQVRYAGDVHVARELDAAAFPDEADSEATPIGFTPPDLCGGTETGDIIDIMVTYTPAARLAMGGEAAIVAEITAAVTKANDAYENSDVDQRLQIVYIGEIDYVEESRPKYDVDNLADPADGLADEVHLLRDIYGADAVAMIVDENSLASYGEAKSVMSSVSTDFAPNAFAVSVYTEAAANFTLAHELSHLMSARHDWEADSKDNLPYEYNHGYYEPINRQWRTIMSSNSTCGTGCVRIPYFSSPDVNYLNAATGVALGYANPADNAQTLNSTAETVANFRCSSGVDNVWMRDTAEDTGLEPDPRTASQNMWESPYIWVRNSQDTAEAHQHQHENPIYGSPNWVYVKLHNGAATTQSGQLMIYYANASAGLRWPADWTQLGTVDLPAFAARSTEVAELEWTSLPGEGHYCLLARWVSDTDPMQTPETEDINANVRNNNNIVWRNLNILSPGADGSMEATVNIAGLGQEYAVSVGPTVDEANGSFLMYGSVQIELADAALQQWLAHGQQGRGFSYTPGSELIEVTEASGAVLEGIYLPGADYNTVTVNYPVALHIQRPPTTPNRTFHLQIEQYHRVDNSAVGSSAVTTPSPGYVSIGAVTYEITKVAPDDTTPEVTITDDGHLTGAMTGSAWVAGGTGTYFFTPNPCNDDGCFKNTGGTLCTMGSIAAVSCESGCNWTENWGAQIGLDTSMGDAWGIAAPASLAIEYSGGAGPYRLLAHVAEDPQGSVYCIENYVSGQYVEPSMFRADCWLDSGEPLPSFQGVDNIGLQVMSDYRSRTFDYCVFNILLQ